MSIFALISNAQPLLIPKGIKALTYTITPTEVSYLHGVSSSIQTQLNSKEPSLGNPSVSGYVLSSTTSGVRSWITPSSGGSSATGEIWTSLTGTYASATTFTMTGTDKDVGLLELSLLTCTNSTGATRRIGYVKTATNSGGTITCNVITDTDLVSGDKDFKIAYNRKVTDYMRLVTIPGEQIADASYSQGMFYSDIQTNSYLLPVDFSVLTPASGTGAALTVNIYKNTTALFGTAPDLVTSTILRSQRPTTNTITAAETVSLRIMSSAGATNKASDFQAKLYIVPQSVYTAFGMNYVMIIGLMLVFFGGSLGAIRINKKLLVVLILFCSFQGFGQIRGYWRFNNNATDASGNGYNLSSISGPTYTIGKKDKGINLGSSNLNKSAYLLNNMGITNSDQCFGGYVYFHSFGTGYKCIFQKSWDGNNPDTEMQWSIDVFEYNSPTKIRARVFGNPSFYVEFTHSWTAGSWHVIYVVYKNDTSTLYLYADGNLVGSSSGNNNFIANNSNFFCLGATADRNSTVPKYYFSDLKFDEIKLLSSAPSPAWVKNENLRLKGFF